MFWTKCKVADRKQRQRTTAMDHRNKIQSLVLPTDHPGDAADCMCEYGPSTCEYGHICHKSANLFKITGFLKPKLHLVTLVLLKPPNSMPASKYGQQRENGRKITKNANGQKDDFFEKIRNFSALDERDCQAAWLFAHSGPFGCQRRAWPDEADPTHFHMHIEKIGQIFKIRGFP